VTDSLALRVTNTLAEIVLAIHLNGSSIEKAPLRPNVSGAPKR